jgi:hypothetical protein
MSRRVKQGLAFGTNRNSQPEALPVATLDLFVVNKKRVRANDDTGKKSPSRL